jgi:ribosomal protein S1
VFERQQYSVTQLNNVVIKLLEAGKIFAVLEVHDKTAVATGTDGPIVSSGLPAVETVTTARILKVYDLQLNVSVNGCAGRVHVTELEDEPEPGVCPLKKYQVGSDIKVKVIGYRTLKDHKYLPITHARCTQAVVECTAKPSKLNTLENNVPLHGGDRAVAYIVSASHNLYIMQLTPQTRGRLHLLNASDDIEVLRNASDHFKVGTGHQVKVIGSGGKGEGFDLAIAGQYHQSKLSSRCKSSEVTR